MEGVSITDFTTVTVAIAIGKNACASSIEQ